MEERRARSRDAEDELVTTLRAIVHEEVKTRTSSWPKKNGDGLLGYIGRLVTPERILLVIVLVYQVGGRVQQFTYDMRGLEQRNREISQHVEMMHESIEQLGAEQAATRGLVDKQDQAIGELRDRSAALKQQIALTVTRGEFMEAVEKRIIPRLERIEQR